MRPGDVVADRFEIDRLAGVGEMGHVYRALDRATGIPVAVKIVTGGAAHATRFAHEARVLSDLTHPTIVRYVARGVTREGDPFLAMEWLEGEDLAQRLARSGLSVADSLAVALRVTEGLGVAHANGLVHRDVKPSNIFSPAATRHAPSCSTSASSGSNSRPTHPPRTRERGRGSSSGRSGTWRRSRRRGTTQSTRARTSSRSVACSSNA